jgi:predicted transcriptional regulator
MSFVPFTHKEKNFAIIDVVSTEGIVLKGREGYLYLEDVSTIKDPEVGQTIFLTQKEGSTNWTLVAEEKPKKTGKGNPVLTAAQRAQFEASCA